MLGMGGGGNGGSAVRAPGRAVGPQIAEPVVVGAALLVGQPALVELLQVVGAAAQVGGGLGAGVALLERLALDLLLKGVAEGLGEQLVQLAVRHEHDEFVG